VRPGSHDDAVRDRIQHLVFRLAGAEYALPLLSVREIVRLEGVAPVPKAPLALRGVMSLRGTPVPILDLSIALGHESAEGTPESCVLVVEGRIDASRPSPGLAVDGVCRVLDLGPDDMAPRPRLGSFVDVDLIRAMARVEAGFVPVLDLERLLASEELRSAAAAAWSAHGA
jgi:purine-binding chemotaxis protein CheW